MSTFSPGSANTRWIAGGMLLITISASLVLWIAHDDELHRPKAPLPEASRAERVSAPAAVTDLNSAASENQAQSDLLAAIQAGNGDRLLALLRQKLASGSVDEVLALLNQVGESHPRLAVELARMLGRTDEEKSEWVSNVTEHWASRDPAEAWQWYSQLGNRVTDDLAHGALFGIIIQQLAIHDPKKLLDEATLLLRRGNRPNSLSPQRMVREGLEALVSTGNFELARRKVEEWAKNPERFEIGAPAYQAIALSMAKDSAKDAGEWLKSMPVSEARNSALGALASHWAWTGGADAMEWAQKLSVEEGRFEVLPRTFLSWIETDASAAADWLNMHRADLESGQQRDQMITSVVALSSIASTDPQGAIQWAALIQNPELRTKSFERIVVKWGMADKTAAVRFVQQTNELSPEQKSRILNAANRSEFVELEE